MWHCLVMKMWCIYTYIFLQSELIWSWTVFYGNSHCLWYFHWIWSHTVVKQPKQTPYLTEAFGTEVCELSKDHHGNFTDGGWGWLERLWECSDSWGTFLVWNEPSHFIEKHTTTNKEHPWPDNKAIWSRLFKSSLYTPSCPQPTPFFVHASIRNCSQDN